MPPPIEENIENAIRDRGNFRLDSFTASPSTIRPFQQSTLNWSIHVQDAHDTVRLKLVGGGLNFQVSPQGSRVVSPSRTTTYKLVVKSRQADVNLGLRTVQVDTSDCMAIIQPEANIRTDINHVVDELLREKADLRRRRDDVVEVETNGIHISLRFKVIIDNWSNPDVNIDAVVGLRVESGNLRHTLSRYEFDIDFPWWADLAHGSFLPAWLAQIITEGSERDEVRRMLISAIEALLTRWQRAVEGQGYRLLTVMTQPNQVLITVCPQ